MNISSRETDKSDTAEEIVDSEVQEPNLKINTEALAPKQGPAVKQPAVPTRLRTKSTNVSVLQSNTLARIVAFSRSRGW